MNGSLSSITDLLAMLNGFGESRVVLEVREHGIIDLNVVGQGSIDDSRLSPLTLLIVLGSVKDS